MRREAKATAAQASAGAPTRRPNARPARLRRVLLAVLALSLFAGVAQAQATDYSYQRIDNFGEAIGSGDGEFQTVGRIAVDDDTGNVYAVDRGNDRVQVFAVDGSSATFLTSFAAGLDNPYGIAIAQSTGVGDEIDVYVSDPGNERIVKLTSDGASVPAFTADPSFTSPAAGSGAEQIGDFEAPLAVDPTTGDLLVADRSDNLVKRFDAEGSYEGSFDGSSSPAGAFTGLADLAVAPNGDVYVVDSEGTIWEGAEGAANPSRVERFDAAGSHLVTISALGLDGLGALTFDGGTNQLVVGDVAPSTTATTVFTPAGGFLAQFVRESPTPPYWNTISGMGVDNGATGRLYIGSNTGLIGPSVAISIYQPVPIPTVTIDPVDTGTVTATEATLTGAVNPEGSTASWHFEYQEAGASSWFNAPVPDEDAGDGTTAEPVSVDIEGLQPSTLYHARLAATNSNGSKASDPVDFETDPAAPVVTTRWAAPRTETTARLNGYVNALNDDTTYFFEYGTDDSYGASVPASEDAPIGAGRTPVLASQEITGLEPETTYHYRLVAENSGGRINGDDLSFVTRGPSETGPPKRGIELVNKPDKGNQSAEAIDLSPNADKVLWGVSGGAPGAPLGARSSFISERTETRWKSRSLLPPVDELVGGGDFRYDLLQSADDFSKFLFDATQGFLSLNVHTFVRVGSDGGQQVMPPLPPNTESFRAVVSKDLSGVFVNTAKQFDPSHVLGTANVYDLGSGEAELVSAMPGTNEAPECGVLNASAGSTGFGGTSFPWVSDNGRRAYFKTNGSDCFGPEDLYLRDLASSTTTLVSGPPLSGPDMGADFSRINSTGTKVLYATQTVLDPDDHNTTRDIYLYTVGSGNECLTCVVEDAGVEALGGISGGAEAGILPSQDFSRIYFISRRALVPGQGVAGDNNLYLLKNGQIHYVAPSTGAGSTFHRGGMTPDGSVLVFPSRVRNITADDNGDTEQYYRYDDGDGSIECVSCPAGRAATRAVGSFGSLTLRGRTVVTDDGRSFVFQTQEALLPEDINGTDDIYEWRNGRLALVTDGETEFPSGFGALALNAMSNNGENVLFSVAAGLTGYEIDNASQLFVAHRGGGFPRPTSPPAPCREDDCQGPLVPAPPLSSPASASFQGRGNVAEAPARKRCRAGKVRRKGRCVAKKKHRRKAACQKKKGRAKQRCVRAHKRHAANKRHAHAKKVRGSK